jgi:hypothetical protein
MDKPKYAIGQNVLFEVTTKDEKTEMTFKNKISVTISAIRASGGYGSKEAYEYGLTTDMPRAGHYGKSPFIWVYEDLIVLDTKCKG